MSLSYNAREPEGDMSGARTARCESVHEAHVARASRAESILENLKEVVFEMDAAANWLFLNPAWKELTGHEVASSIGHSLFDYVHPDDRELNQLLLLPMVKRGHDCLCHEIRCLRKDGGVRWVEVCSRLTLGPHGEVTGSVGTLSDISDRKAAEDRLKLAASVFSNAGEGIMITSAQGSIVDVNPAFESITGYGRAEVLGKNPKLLSSGRQDAAFYTDMWSRLGLLGFWQGDVWNRRKDGNFYVEKLTITTIRDVNGKVSNYVGIFSDITQQKIQTQELEQIAYYDSLTGLPNRRLLADRLKQAMVRARRGAKSLAVVYLDLDGFKAVNDAHGHGYGDQLLIAIAKRMQQAVRETDTICRIGGDEFIALFDQFQDIDECLPLLRRLLTSISLPVRVGATVLKVTGSAGISLYPKHEDVEADQLMRQADEAMYQAKELGKNRFCIFDKDKDRPVIVRSQQS